MTRRVQTQMLPIRELHPIMAQIEDGTAQTEGNLGVLEQLASAMIDFDLLFELLPGTKGPSDAEDLNDFELGPIGEGHE